MALNHKRTGDTASVAADAVCALANNGYLKIYSGEQPVSADTGLAGQPVLAQLRFGDPAFEPAVDGIAVAYPITPEDSALASGTATWFRVYSETNTKLWDGSVGESDANIVLDSTDIVEGDPVEIVGFVYVENTEPA